MRLIYISPHLDDVVLSCGGLIRDQVDSGLSVEIWTIVCGFAPPGNLSILAKHLHQLWGTETADETVTTRRQEDLKAAQILGASILHFDIPDCIYRRSFDNQLLYSDPFVPPHSYETNLPQNIAQTLRAKIRIDDIVIGPLGIGGHVDHIIVRQGLEILLLPLMYYADFPYTIDHPNDLITKTVDMKPIYQQISKNGLRAWQDSINEYKSQISTLFENSDHMQESVKKYWANKSGIDLWKYS